MTNFDQIKKDLTQGKKVTQNFPCKNAPQILAHITISPATSDTCRLTGYPVDIKTSNKIEGYSRKTLSNKPIVHVELEIRALCGMVEADYLKKSSPSVSESKPKAAIHSDQFFADTFLRCPELQDHSIPIPSWGTSTCKKM